MFGSPPLARRAPRTRRIAVDEGRVTSARAESTRPRCAGPPPPSDHLRSRGEHETVRMPSMTSFGSPPLARRALPGLGAGVRERRITSARAESTWRCMATSPSCTAHLRSHGEHVTNPWTVGRRSGSPPLARRAQADLGGPLAFHRLTSARAESTPGRGTGSGSTAAHLRSREEHRSLSVFHGRPSGSPPLARRAQTHDVRAVPEHRLTSARAESTSCPGSDRARRPAHLRSRRYSPDPRYGSPPLMRRARGTLSGSTC